MGIKLIEIGLAVLLTVNMAQGVSNPVNFWIAVITLAMLIFSILSRPDIKIGTLTKEGMELIRMYMRGPSREPKADTDALLYVATWLDQMDDQVNRVIPQDDWIQGRRVQDRLREISRSIDGWNRSQMIERTADGPHPGGIEQYQEEDR